MSRLRKWKAPEGLEEAYEKLVTGRGSMSLQEAGEVINFTNAWRTGDGTARNRLIAEYKATFEGTDDEATSALIDTAETQGGTIINDWTNRAHTIATQAGLALPERKNYVPHHLTVQAVEWMRSADPKAVAFRKEFKIPIHDLDEVSPAMLERKLVARPDRPYKIEGRDFHIKEGTIKDWNTQFASVVPEADFKFFQDDWAAISARYTDGLSRDIGTAAAVRHLLQSKSGLVKSWDARRRKWSTSS